jgi:surfeit locus 1 family protein
LPRPLPADDLTAGPHLGYAIQWFAFALVGVVGYAILLRKVWRDGTARGD